MYNSFLLDTGANGIMVAGFAATEMEEAGYQTACYYDEAGVAGTEEFGLSVLKAVDAELAMNTTSGVYVVTIASRACARSTIVRVV